MNLTALYRTSVRRNPRYPALTLDWDPTEAEIRAILQRPYDPRRAEQAARVVRPYERAMAADLRGIEASRDEHFQEAMEALETQGLLPAGYYNAWAFTLDALDMNELVQVASFDPSWETCVQMAREFTASMGIPHINIIHSRRLSGIVPGPLNNRAIYGCAVSRRAFPGTIAWTTTRSNWVVRSLLPSIRSDDRFMVLLRILELGFLPHILVESTHSMGFVTEPMASR